MNINNIINNINNNNNNNNNNSDRTYSGVHRASCKMNTGAFPG